MFSTTTLHQQHVRYKFAGCRQTGGEMIKWEEVVRDLLHMCVTCNLVYATHSSLQNHIKRHHNPLCVEHSPATVLQIPLRDLLTEIRKNSTKGSSRCTGFHCQKCDTHFTLRDIPAHICVNAARQASCVAADPDGLLLSKSQQTLLFIRRHNHHMCHECGNTFKRPDKLRTHLDFGHGNTDATGSGLYQCTRCPYSTSLQGYFRLHLSNHHGLRLAPKTYVCEVCGKGYSTQCSLNNHKESQHLRSHVFACQLCPKVFYLRRYLLKHLKVHSVLRNYKCDECGQAFKSQSNLECHRRIHTGYKPYQCELCPCAFVQKNSLNVHMKKHKKQSTLSTTA